MRRILIAAVVPLFLLAACAVPGGSGPSVQITRAEVAESAQLAATALETAWQGYLATGAKVPPDIKAKVDLALGGFQTLANALSASPGSVTLAGVANDVLTACNAVMADLPPGTLPPNVVAAVTAGEIVAHAVLTVVEQQSSTPK
jgi:hypothetical protein